MVADAATKNQQTFLDHGLAPDFITQLRADITLLTTSNAAQNAAVTQRATATSGIKDTNKVAHDILALLNSAIVPALKGNAPLLAGWKAAKKISTPTALPAQPTGLAPESPAVPTTTPSAAPATPPSTTPGTAAAAAPAVQAATPAA